MGIETCMAAYEATSRWEFSHYRLENNYQMAMLRKYA